MTYLIMENHPGYSVALDEAGRFLRVENHGYEIGQTVGAVHPLRRRPRPLRTVPLLAVAGALAACLVAVLAAVFLNTAAPSAYASVYLTINPGVRLDVDREEAVTGLEGTNDDGIVLVEAYSWKGKPMTLVLEELVDRAIDRGFLTEGGTVALDIDAPDESWFESAGIRLRRELSDYMAGRFTVTIEIGPYKRPAVATPALTDEPSTTHEGETTRTAVPSESTTTTATTTTTTAQTSHHSSGTNSHTTGHITWDQAVDIAAAHAGVARADIALEKAELDEDDEGDHYDVEFTAGGWSYDYEIDAVTGRILKNEKERDD